jgi:hypothetical protein
MSSEGPMASFDAVALKPGQRTLGEARNATWTGMVAVDDTALALTDTRGAGRSADESFRRPSVLPT